MASSFIERNSLFPLMAARDKQDILQLQEFMP